MIKIDFRGSNGGANRAIAWINQFSEGYENYRPLIIDLERSSTLTIVDMMQQF